MSSLRFHIVRNGGRRCCVCTRKNTQISTKKANLRTRVSASHFSEIVEEKLSMDTGRSIAIRRTMPLRQNKAMYPYYIGGTRGRCHTDFLQCDIYAKKGRWIVISRHFNYFSLYALKLFRQVTNSVHKHK